MAGILLGILTLFIFNRDQKMASGRERSVSIYTLLHLVFHVSQLKQEKRVEKKRRKKKTGKRGTYPDIHFCIHVFFTPEPF